MKTMRKNAREHNINKVTQELTGTGLHIDNEESLKKIIINVKDCYKNKLNKTKKSKGLFHAVNSRHECSKQTDLIYQQQQSTVRCTLQRWHAIDRIIKVEYEKLKYFKDCES